VGAALEIHQKSSSNSGCGGIRDCSLLKSLTTEAVCCSCVAALAECVAAVD